MGTKRSNDDANFGNGDGNCSDDIIVNVKGDNDSATDDDDTYIVIMMFIMIMATVTIIMAVAM